MGEVSLVSSAIVFDLFGTVQGKSKEAFLQFRFGQTLFAKFIRCYEMGIVYAPDKVFVKGSLLRKKATLGCAAAVKASGW